MFERITRPISLRQFSAAFPHSLVPPSAHGNDGLHHSRKLWANSAKGNGEKNVSASRQDTVNENERQSDPTLYEIT